MLRATRIAETSLYVEDLERAVNFYIQLLGLTVLLRDARFCALQIVDEQVLLLFHRGASAQATVFPFGTVPAHDGHGSLHVCFGIEEGSADNWERRLAELGIAVESRISWPHGPISLYFRDPDNHAVELATPGLWRGSW